MFVVVVLGVEQFGLKIEQALQVERAEPQDLIERDRATFGAVDGRERIQFANAALHPLQLILTKRSPGVDPV